MPHGLLDLLEGEACCLSPSSKGGRSEFEFESKDEELKCGAAEQAAHVVSKSLQEDLSDDGALDASGAVDERMAALEARVAELEEALLEVIAATSRLVPSPVPMRPKPTANGAGAHQ